MSPQSSSTYHLSPAQLVLAFFQARNAPHFLLLPDSLTIPCPLKHENPIPPILFISILWWKKPPLRHATIFLQIQQWALFLGSFSRKRAAKLEDIIALKWVSCQVVEAPPRIRKAQLLTQLLLSLLYNPASISHVHITS